MKNETFEDVFEQFYGFRPDRIAKHSPKANPNEGRYVYSVDYHFADRRYRITEAMNDGATVAIMLELPTGVTLPYHQHCDAESAIVERERGNTN